MRLRCSHLLTSRCLLVGLLVCLPVMGCELFQSSPGLSENGEKGLPPLKPPPDAIQLEIVFAERPRGDKLLGDQLWRDVDQILGLDPELQKDLEKNGFRVGVVASHPPAALQTILGLSSGAETTAATDSQKLTGNRLFVRSGTTSEITVSPTYPSCDLTLWSSYASKEGEDRSYGDVRCQFRVQATRVQEGWVRLEFIPEILHGAEQMRPNAGLQNWELTAGKASEPLYNQRFSAMLNVGEMALVTCQDSAEGTVGHRFFTGPEGEDGVQRLLLIRLAHLTTGEQVAAK